MSIAFPLGFPSQDDPGVPWTQTLKATGAAAASRTLTVPGGEMWLVTAVQARVDTGMTVSPREVDCNIKDADGNRIAVMGVAWPNLADYHPYVTWAIGLPATTVLEVPASGQPGTTQGLPWLVMGPGWSIQVRIDATDAADLIRSMTANITYWQWGGTPSPADEPMGPFMFVPGPSSGAVAA